MSQFEVRIVIAEDGTLNVSGPLDNKILMLGVLEEAKEAVHKYHEKKQDRIVQPAPPGLIISKN